MQADKSSMSNIQEARKLDDETHIHEMRVDTSLSTADQTDSILMQGKDPSMNQLNAPVSGFFVLYFAVFFQPIKSSRFRSTTNQMTITSRLALVLKALAQALAIMTLASE